MNPLSQTDLAGWKLENSYTQLPRFFFAHQMPEGSPSPTLCVLNESLAQEMGLSPQALQSPLGISVLSGNALPPRSQPIAQAYAGHQFGYQTMLGDGRAVLLGEQRTPAGERLDIQLKGAGRTLYARGGDGRAALGPMLREYLISEAMHALGIDSTRSLAVVRTGREIWRQGQEAGAVLTRVARSHLRVGTFEFAAGHGKEAVQALADYTLTRHFPHLIERPDRYLALLDTVSALQASLIAKWQLVGFVHGVMNTDNMSICGQGIDYGPCAFLDVYDPHTVFSSIDRQGRYAYRNQPEIASWNLSVLAHSLLALFGEEKEQAQQSASQVLQKFPARYQSAYQAGLRQKLGLVGDSAVDDQLGAELLALLERFEADYSYTFRALTIGQKPQAKLAESAEFADWQIRWQERVHRQARSLQESQEAMRKSNPALIPRNARVEEVLSQALQGHMEPFERFLKALRDPYAYAAEQEAYGALPDPCQTPYRTFCGT